MQKKLVNSEIDVLESLENLLKYLKKKRSEYSKKLKENPTNGRLTSAEKKEKENREKYYKNKLFDIDLMISQINLKRKILTKDDKK